MKYIYLANKAAQEIIPEFDPIFPGVPITERYAPDFLSQCIQVDDDAVPPTGWIFNPETGIFSAPPEPEPVEPVPETPGAPTVEERVTALENALLEML